MLKPGKTLVLRGANAGRYTFCDIAQLEAFKPRDDLRDAADDNYQAEDDLSRSLAPMSISHVTSPSSITGCNPWSPMSTSLVSPSTTGLSSPQNDDRMPSSDIPMPNLMDASGPSADASPIMSTNTLLNPDDVDALDNILSIDSDDLLTFDPPSSQQLPTFGETFQNLSPKDY